METIIQTHPEQLSRSVSDYRRLNDYLIKPIKAGFMGFLAILMIIVFINLLLYIIGTDEKSILDFLDLSFAGVGFVLKFAENLLRSMSRELY